MIIRGDWNNAVKNCTKTIELVLNRRKYTTVSVGQQVLIMGGGSVKNGGNGILQVQISAINDYDTLDLALAALDVAKIGPGMTLLQIKNKYRETISLEDELNYGIRAITFSLHPQLVPK